MGASCYTAAAGLRGHFGQRRPTGSKGGRGGLGGGDNGGWLEGRDFATATMDDVATT